MIFSCGNFTGCRSANATRNAVGKLSQYKSGGNTWFLRNQMIENQRKYIDKETCTKICNLIIKECQKN